MSELPRQVAEQPAFLIQQNQSTGYPFGKFLVAGVAMAGLALAGPGLTTQPEASATASASQSPDIPYDIAMPTDRTLHADGNLKTDPVTDAFVDKLIANPRDLRKDYVAAEYTRVKKRDQSLFYLAHYVNWWADNYKNADYNLRQSLADKYDVTLHDSRRTTKQLKSLHLNTTPFANYYTATAAYLGRFGVDLRLATTEDVKNTLGKKTLPPTADVLETASTKASLQQLINAFGSLPQEYINLAMGEGEKTIYLVKNAPLKKDPKRPGQYESNFGGMAYTSGAHSAFALNVQTGFDVHTVDHELSHLADAAMIGDGAEEDKAYTAENGGQPYLDKDRNKPYVVDVYDKAYLHLGQAVARKQLAQNFSEACDIAKQADDSLDKLAMDIRYVSDYAAGNNVVEDKGEVGALLLEDDATFSKVTSKRLPVIRAKAMVWLHRIAHFKPRVAGYIIETRNLTENYLPHFATHCDEPLNGSK